MAGITTAQGSRYQAVYAVEDSWAELPTTPVPYNLRTTGFGLQLSKNSFQSEEIRSDRQISDMRHGMFSVAGDIPVEMSYGAFDDLIAAAMFNDWSSDDTIEIGTTQKSIRIQRAFTDIGEYHEFLGCVPTSWSISMAPDAIVTATFSFMGREMETTRTLTGATDKATNSPFDSFSGFIREGGNSTGDEIAVVTGLDFTLENSLEPIQVLGSNKAEGLPAGRATVTGTVTAYFNNSDLLDKFIGETESEIQFQLKDTLGNTLEFYMPRIKYSGADISVDSESPVTMSLPFQALYDTTSGIKTLQITRS